MLNFRQILSDVDVRSVLDQIAAYEALCASRNLDAWRTADPSWKEGKEGSSIYDVDTIALRATKPNLSRPALWDRPAYEMIPAARQIVRDLMYAVVGEWVGNVCITRLLPGQVIDEHVDESPPGMPPFFQRYQVPLNEAGFLFRCGGEERWLRPGAVWWFNKERRHSVAGPKISMRIDVRPHTPAAPAS